MGSLFCVLILAGLASLADRGAGNHLLSWFFCCTAVAVPVMAMSDMTDPDSSPATLAAYTLALVLLPGPSALVPNPGRRVATRQSGVRLPGGGRADFGRPPDAVHTAPSA